MWAFANLYALSTIFEPCVFVPVEKFLLHGNPLCDQRPYYLAWIESSMKPLMEEWNLLELIFIKGREPPNANMEQDRNCGGYAFTRVVGKH